MEHFLSISDIFLTEYMPHAPEPYVKVYLYGLYQLQTLKKIDHSLLASVLQMLPSEVLLAWNYWESEKVIRKKNIKSDLDFQVEFTILHSKNLPTTYQTSCPNYTTKEIEIYLQNSKEVKQLFSMAKTKLGRNLSYAELGIIFSFYDWLRLPIDVIDYLLDFCISQGISQMKDFQDMAITWAKNEITTAEKALDFMRSHMKS